MKCLKSIAIPLHDEVRQIYVSCFVFVSFCYIVTELVFNQLDRPDKLTVLWFSMASTDRKRNIGDGISEIEQVCTNYKVYCVIMMLQMEIIINNNFRLWLSD